MLIVALLVCYAMVIGCYASTGYLDGLLTALPKTSRHRSLLLNAAILLGLAGIIGFGILGFVAQTAAQDFGCAVWGAIFAHATGLNLMIYTSSKSRKIPLS